MKWEQKQSILKGTASILVELNCAGGLWSVSSWNLSLRTLSGNLFTPVSMPGCVFSIWHTSFPFQPACPLFLAWLRIQEKLTPLPFPLVEKDHILAQRGEHKNCSAWWLSPCKPSWCDMWFPQTDGDLVYEKILRQSCTGCLIHGMWVCFLCVIEFFRFSCMPTTLRKMSWHDWKTNFSMSPCGMNCAQHFWVLCRPRRWACFTTHL